MTDKPTSILFLGTECLLNPDDGFGTTYLGHPSPGTDLTLYVTPEAAPAPYTAEMRSTDSVDGDHGRWYAQVEGATLGECESKLKAEIFRTERSLEYLCRRLEPSNPLEQACEYFLDRWRQIPPLVRASYSYNLVKHTLRERFLVPGEAAIAERMPRRSRVNASFDQAADTLRLFAIALTNEADNEAEKAGIDADISGTRGMMDKLLLDALHDKDVP